MRHGSLYHLYTFSFHHQYFFHSEQLSLHIYQIESPRKNLTGLFNQDHPCLGRGFQARLPHSLMAVGGMLLLQF